MAYASYVVPTGEFGGAYREWSNTASQAERQKLALSFWLQVNKAVAEPDFSFGLNYYGDGAIEYRVTDTAMYLAYYDGVSSSDDFEEIISGASLTLEVWDHYLFTVDTTQTIPGDRVKIYRNGTLLSPSVEVPPALDFAARLLASGDVMSLFVYSEDGPAKFAFVEFVTGSAPGPDAFAFDDNGTWTRKPYTGARGSYGFLLDGSDGFNDASGNGHHFLADGEIDLDPNDLPPHVAAEEGFSGIYIGNTQINAIKHGTNDVVAVYHGETKIFEAG